MSGNSVKQSLPRSSPMVDDQLGITLVQLACCFKKMRMSCHEASVP